MGSVIYVQWLLNLMADAPFQTGITCFAIKKMVSTVRQNQAIKVINSIHPPLSAYLLRLFPFLFLFCTCWKQTMWYNPMNKHTTLKGEELAYCRFSFYLCMAVIMFPKATSPRACACCVGLWETYHSQDERAIAAVLWPVATAD